MTAHWVPPRQPGDTLPLDPNVNRILDRTLDELTREPDIHSVIASTKAWSRATWFTRDGENFYFRDPDTTEPDTTLPPSSRDEVIMNAQEQYRRLLRSMRLYERFLEPKVQHILHSDLSKPEKVDRIYWLRLHFPAHVACRVPVVFDGRIERFCWGWDFNLLQEGISPSRRTQRSDEHINRVLAAPCILWLYSVDDV